MVRNGDFTAELVDADTKQGFKEHTDGLGATYVEVEPDVEYFIRVKNDSHQGVVCKYQVDGKGLGYKELLFPDAESIVGLKKGATSTKTALKFQLVRHTQRTHESSRPLWGTGEICCIHFYEYQVVLDGSRRRSIGKRVSTRKNRGNTDNKVAKYDKAVKSTRGTKTETTAYSGYDGRSCGRYRRGRYLRSIRLKYCSVLGLIEAGILPKPPAHECHILQNPESKRTEDADGPLVEPKRIRLSDPTGNLPAQEYDMYDLTQVEESIEENSADKQNSENTTQGARCVGGSTGEAPQLASLPEQERPRGLPSSAETRDASLTTETRAGGFNEVVQPTAAEATQRSRWDAVKKFLLFPGNGR